MYILNITNVMKKMTVNRHRNFIFENYYKRIGFVKERSYYSMKCLKRKDLLLLATKLIKKTPDPHNTKEHYRSFIRKKNAKSVKQSKTIIQEPKSFEKLNIVDIQSVIIEHPKTLHKLSKTKDRLKKFPK